MLWTILGMRDNINKKKNLVLIETTNTQDDDTASEQINIVSVEEEVPELDSWGRLID
jgi:hypothetical protein